MQIELGTHVQSRDEHDIGVLKKLILDPSGEHVKAVVIEKGLLLKDDIELPVEAIHAAPGQPIHVDYTTEEVKNLPRYDEWKYTMPPPDIAERYGYPTSGLIWPAPNPYPGSLTGPPIVYPIVTGEPVADERGEAADSEEPEEIRERMDLENAVIEEGSEVYSRDGEKVGEIETVQFDPETGRPTHFVVRKGWLFTEDIELPAGTVASVDDRIVTLNIDKERVEAWKNDNTVPLF